MGEDKNKKGWDDLQKEKRIVRESPCEFQEQEVDCVRESQPAYGRKPDPWDEEKHAGLSLLLGGKSEEKSDKEWFRVESLNEEAEGGRSGILAGFPKRKKGGGLSF